MTPRHSSLVVLLALFCALCFAASHSYVPPAPAGGFSFWEPFQNLERWTMVKEDPNDKSKIFGEIELGEASEFVGIPGDKGAYLPVGMKYYSAFSKLKFPFDIRDHEIFVAQYELRLTNGLDCGGGYLKFLSEPFDDKNFTSSTPYSIMFGVDKCGSDAKVHFIVRHQNSKTKIISEKHLTPPPVPRADVITHLYTLIIKEKDNTFQILIDMEEVVKGSLLSDAFHPPFNPPKTIDDPTDVKPSDWVDEKEIDDVSVQKPLSWNEDEPEYVPDLDARRPEHWQENEKEYIPDPEAKKPEDWDDETDGVWECPIILNPKCYEGNCGEWKHPLRLNPLFRGKWSPPKIPNPEYKGEWKARQISNPDFVYDHHPARFTPIAAVAIEVWTLGEGQLYDNILVTGSKEVAKVYAEMTWKIKHENERKLFLASGGELDDGKDEETIWDELGDTVSFLWSHFLDDPLLGVAILSAIILPISVAIYCALKTDDEDQSKIKLTHLSSDTCAASPTPIAPTASPSAAAAATVSSPKSGAPRKPKKD